MPDQPMIVRGEQKKRDSAPVAVASSKPTPAPERISIQNSDASLADSEMQCQPGIRYELGRLGPHNHDDTTRRHRLSADQNHAKTVFFLGFLYERGKGVPENHAAAMKWNRFAAGQEYGPAPFNRGVAYVRGMGTTRDCSAAKKCLRKVAENSVQQGCPSYQDLQAEGFGAQFLANKELLKRHSTDEQRNAKKMQILVEQQSKCAPHNLPESEYGPAACHSFFAPGCMNPVEDSRERKNDMQSNIQNCLSSAGRWRAFFSTP